MSCPTCGHHGSEVTHTRARSAGTWRRRQCLRCGVRFSTREVAYDPSEGPEADDEAAQYVDPIRAAIRSAGAPRT